MFESESKWADDYSRDLLRSGIIEVKAGNREAARRYLDRALYMSRDHDAMAEGWYWMSQVTDDPTERRKALENCLANDLQHTRARRALAVLDGKLKADEIVDPDALPPVPAGLQNADAWRFMCPRCGGRMSFSPDGQSLVCEYCLGREGIRESAAALGSQDFLIAMATARGHGKPLREQAFHCLGCGAEFILPPGRLSVTCAYCGSPHVINVRGSRQYLAPDGILPHRFDQSHALDILKDWVEDLKIEPQKPLEKPRGLYLPIWVFELGGRIDYRGEVTESAAADEFGRRMPGKKQVTDRRPIMLEAISIPASRKLSAPFVRLVPTFDLKSMQPYDPRYLADWPAELYDVPMADASLDARAQAVARFEQELARMSSPVQLIGASSANLAIESFRLELLPVWMTEAWFDARNGIVLINGQNGMVQGEAARKAHKDGISLMDWLADLVKE